MGRCSDVSHAFWMRQFGGDRGMIGKPITLNNAPVTVAGVLPDTFDFGAVFSPGMKVDIFLPLVMDEIRLWGNTLALIGRLRPGVSVAQAQAEAKGAVSQVLLEQEISGFDWRLYCAAL